MKAKKRGGLAAELDGVLHHASPQVVRRLPLPLPPSQVCSGEIL